MSELGNGEVVRERVRRKGRKRLKVSKQREKKDKKIRECIESGRREFSRRKRYRDYRQASARGQSIEERKGKSKGKVHREAKGELR